MNLHILEDSVPKSDLFIALTQIRILIIQVYFDFSFIERHFYY